jgi:hypothetical protein
MRSQDQDAVAVDVDEDLVVPVIREHDQRTVNARGGPGRSKQAKEEHNRKVSYPHIDQYSSRPARTGRSA